MPPMMILTDIIEQLEKIDQQIIKLLEERVQIATGNSLDTDQEADVVSLWLEEAGERGLDEARMERLAKGVNALSRVVKE